MWNEGIFALLRGGGGVCLLAVSVRMDLLFVRGY